MCSERRWRETGGTVSPGGLGLSGALVKNITSSDFEQRPSYWKRRAVGFKRMPAEMLELRAASQQINPNCDLSPKSEPTPSCELLRTCCELVANNRELEMAAGSEPG